MNSTETSNLPRYRWGFSVSGRPQGTNEETRLADLSTNFLKDKTTYILCTKFHVQGVSNKKTHFGNKFLLEFECVIIVLKPKAGA